MSSCAMIRGHMLDLARGTASDAVRLESESHLETCAACREERSVWTVVQALRDDAGPRLDPFGERRVLARLVAARAAAAGPAPRAARMPRLALGLALVGVVAVGAVLAPRPGLERLARLFGRLPPAAPVAEGLRIEAATPGAIAFSGAGVSYQPGTTLTFHTAARTVDVTRGEVDVDVDPRSGLPGHFRVATKKFVVEVLGTRFVVTPTSVRTLRGRVRILDRAGHEVAVLHAGEWWSGADELAEPAPPAAPPPLVAPVAAVEVAPAHRDAPARSHAPARLAAPARVEVSELLARSRAALAAGNADLARTLIDRAFAAGPAEAEAPALELLRADALLVARRSDDAIVAYRRVARHRARAPEGETAAFAVGQLLFERGAESEAGAALYDYLARYPHGRFVREARERLTQLDAKP